MRNYVQEGTNITVTAAADATSGEGVLMGNLFGIATTDAASGDTLTLTVEGVFSMPKVSTDVFTVGAAVYWDDTAKVVTTTASGNTKIGVSVSAAGNPSATVNVRLNESF